MAKSIGFISTRFAGTDGVSLESGKWAHVLWKLGYVSHWFAGELDRDPLASMLVPEAHFEHAENKWINEQILGDTKRSMEVTRRIHQMRFYLKNKIYEFIEKYKIDLLLPQNCLAIPMHIPLGLALTEVLAETGMPAIAHHHDFYWERTRFAVSSVNEYIDMAFPPRLRNIEHVVINSMAQEELSWRKGLTSITIPNMLDFEKDHSGYDEYTKNIREEIGVKPDDILFLQPTRVVPRKGIELAIELVHKLDNPKIKLVISHESGDEGMNYPEYIKQQAKYKGVELIFIDDIIAPKRSIDSNGNKKYTLWDIYPHCDFVTYPSIYEGFGNAFLEALMFKKPILVNRYSIYITDIEPRGFNVVTMDGYVTDEVVAQTQKILDDEVLRTKLAEENFATAIKHYSYSVLENQLKFLLNNIYGLEN